MRFAVLFALVSCALAAQQQQQQRQIAITLDDLPCAGGCRDLSEIQSINSRILAALRGVPAIGFVNESGLNVRGERDARVAQLEQWLGAGLELGNHTYSHPDPNKVPLEKYEDDIVQGEVVLRLLLQDRPNSRLYFRHPFTHTGPTAEYKAGIDRFLDSRGYTIAPFTVENSDWMWAYVYRKALERGDTAMAARVRKGYLETLETALRFAEQVSLIMFQREIPQILLAHANLLNADVLPDLLTLLRTRGYTVVSLARAMEDAAYTTPDRYVSRFGPSWYARWAVALRLPNPMAQEPDPPAWVRNEYARLTR